MTEPTTTTKVFNFKFRERTDVTNTPGTIVVGTDDLLLFGSEHRDGKIVITDKHNPHEKSPL